MDVATIGAKTLMRQGYAPAVDVSPEINACTVKYDVVMKDGTSAPWYILFKNETHNHPTEIEPFGGAATCLGGAIRDPLSGRAYVYQAMRITGAADINAPFDKNARRQTAATRNKQARGKRLFVLRQSDRACHGHS